MGGNMKDERSIANKILMDINGVPADAETRNEIQTIIEELTLPLREESENLKKENSQWKELHERSATMVIPGETDSVDAYRKMWFEMKEALEEAVSEFWAGDVPNQILANEQKFYGLTKGIM